MEGLDWGKLSNDQVRQYMDERYSTGEAYAPAVPRDIVQEQERRRVALQLYSSEVTKEIAGCDIRILDLACGDAPLATNVDGYEEYIGADISEVAVEICQKKYASDENVHFVQMAATELDFEEGYFDCVFCLEVIEHVANPKTVLDQIWRVLRPGGFLILSSPNSDSVHLLVNRLLGNEDFTWSYDHVEEYSYAEMTEMLENCGFMLTNASGCFFNVYVGTPHIGGELRELCDYNSAAIQLMRKLGERVGPEYAFL